MERDNPNDRVGTTYHREAQHGRVGDLRDRFDSSCERYLIRCGGIILGFSGDGLPDLSAENTNIDHARPQHLKSLVAPP